MKVHKENMERVTKMVAEEVQVLKLQCDRDRENAKILKIEAEKVRRFNILRDTQLSFTQKLFTILILIVS